MDIVALIKEFGILTGGLIFLFWLFIRQSDRTQKILSDQAKEAKQDATKQAERFFAAIDNRDDLLRETMENFGHLRALGNEHSSSLGRIEQNTRDRDRHKQ